MFLAKKKSFPGVSIPLKNALLIEFYLFQIIHYIVLYIIKNIVAITNCRFMLLQMDRHANTGNYLCPDHVILWCVPGSSCRTQARIWSCTAKLLRDVINEARRSPHIQVSSRIDFKPRGATLCLRHVHVPDTPRYRRLLWWLASSFAERHSDRSKVSMSCAHAMRNVRITPYHELFRRRWNECLWLDECEQQ